ncbi:transposase, partial [Patescibacteria group bacterium]|nr:transposase [Patescibacteria group bacterium]
MKNLEAFLVTWVTYNSRVFERMIRFGVRRGKPIILTSQDEIEITKLVKNMVIDQQIKILAYNICRDHIHLILVCEESELGEIVRRFKGKTSYLFNKSETSGFNPLYRDNKKIVSRTRKQAPLSQVRSRGKTQAKLWAQKFNRVLLDGNDSLSNAIDYVERNREKHGLPLNNGL